MNRLRIAILLLGPLPIVAASMAFCSWVRVVPDAAPSGNQAYAAEQSGQAPARSDQAPEPSDQAVVQVAYYKPADDEVSPSLGKACDETAKRLREKLDEKCGLIVHVPFVMAGDMSKAQLEHWYSDTVGPSAKAMAHTYFRVPPNRPITVLLFTGEQSYDHYAKELYGDEGVSVYGYYKPQIRTLVMNIGTGGGTLVHELTHALMAFDFPDVPDWFNEGLASLHEHCQFRDNNQGIVGIENWRLPGLQKAIKAGKLRPLKDLMEADDFRGEREGLNYAQARYFCLYLQRRDLLEKFYARFRKEYRDDPRGVKILADLLDRPWPEVDKDFQAFALELKPQ